MSDTFFSGAPHWTWFIIPYFFVGGLAGGAYFLAAVLDWFGRPEDRPVVRTGYDIAAVGAILSGLLLTIDLGRPLRFWHMLFQSENFPPSCSKVGRPSRSAHGRSSCSDCFPCSRPSGRGPKRGGSRCRRSAPSVAW